MNTIDPSVVQQAALNVLLAARTYD